MALILIFCLKETIDKCKLGHLHCGFQSSDQLERNKNNQEAPYTLRWSGSKEGLI